MCGEGKLEQGNHLHLNGQKWEMIVLSDNNVNKSRDSENSITRVEDVVLLPSSNPYSKLIRA